MIIGVLLRLTIYRVIYPNVLIQGNRERQMLLPKQRVPVSVCGNFLNLSDISGLFQEHTIAHRYIP